MKKSSLVSVRQIIRQILAKASVVRQPKKSSTIFFDCWAAEVPSDEWIRDVPGGVHNHAQDLGLESFQDFNVGGGSSAPELYTIGPDGFQYCFVE
jgi:hypothetical protein